MSGAAAAGSSLRAKAACSMVAWKLSGVAAAGRLEGCVCARIRSMHTSCSAAMEGSN